MFVDERCRLAEEQAFGAVAEDSVGSWQAAYSGLKAALDFVLALFLLALSGPVILALMALVRLTSRGSALYSQVRLGRGGRIFRIYKIRTMLHDCERLTGPRWATPRDPRVTRLGALLRRTHLDELPQLWNVLRGEMSLVGPRPERPEFARQLDATIPGYRERLRVRPGITGLAQIQLPPDSDLESVRRKVSCDRRYISHMGIWLDLRILIGTAFLIGGMPVGLVRSTLALPGEDDLSADLATEGDTPSTQLVLG
jgi:lipopolysaccharide/colanic/teichoic acid biosynthesis glycosyltransferase